MPRYYRSSPSRKPEKKPAQRPQRTQPAQVTAPRTKNVRRQTRRKRFSAPSIPVLDVRKLRPDRARSAPGKRSAPLHTRLRRRLAQRAWNFSHAGAGLLLLAALAGLGYGFISFDFFVYDASVRNARYTPISTVYETAEINGFSAFFINPAEIAARVRQLPHVRDATVRVSLPDRVQIELVEREPIVLYQIQGQSFWIDAEGVISPAFEAREGLIKLIDDDAAASVDQKKLDPALLQAILHITDTLPQVNTFRFQKPYGLFFFSPEGWRVYLGSAYDMDEKLEAWEATRRQILDEGAFPQEVDLRFKRPFWR